METGEKKRVIIVALFHAFIQIETRHLISGLERLVNKVER